MYQLPRVITTTLSIPSIQEVVDKFQTQFQGKEFLMPKGKDKGTVGKHLEALLEIPSSSSLLDCTDGEVKTFPLKYLTRTGKFGKKGDLVPKETVAISMMQPENLVQEAFDTKLAKKISKILFVPYVRQDDTIKYLPCTVFTLNSNNAILAEIQEDYNNIKEYFIQNNKITSKVGTLLQCRTKGAGRNAPKTRAFYFRKEFLMRIKM